jgi:hypothetical protein
LKPVKVTYKLHSRDTVNEDPQGVQTEDEARVDSTRRGERRGCPVAGVPTIILHPLSEGELKVMIRSGTCVTEGRPGRAEGKGREKWGDQRKANEKNAKMGHGVKNAESMRDNAMRKAK